MNTTTNNNSNNNKTISLNRDGTLLKYYSKNNTFIFFPGISIDAGFFIEGYIKHYDQAFLKYTFDFFINLLCCPNNNLRYLMLADYINNNNNNIIKLQFIYPGKPKIIVNNQINEENAKNILEAIS